MDCLKMIKDARKQGGSIAEIARTTGVCFSTLYNFLRTEGALKLSPKSEKKVVDGLKNFTPRKKAGPTQAAVVTALKSVDLKEVAHKTGLSLPHLQKLMQQPEYYNAKLENRNKIIDAVREIQEEEFKKLNSDREKLEKVLK